jgi:hypothetical protein
MEDSLALMVWHDRTLEAEMAEWHELHPSIDP